MKYWKAERKVFARSLTDMLKSTSICEIWICFLSASVEREDASVHMFKRNGWGGQNLINYLCDNGNIQSRSPECEDAAIGN